jgi:hypothetical protein
MGPPQQEHLVPGKSAGVLVGFRPALHSGHKRRKSSRVLTLEDLSLAREAVTLSTLPGIAGWSAPSRAVVILTALRRSSRLMHQLA